MVRGNRIGSIVVKASAIADGERRIAVVEGYDPPTERSGKVGVDGAGPRNRDRNVALQPAITITDFTRYIEEFLPPAVSPELRKDRYPSAEALKPPRFTAPL